METNNNSKTGFSNLPQNKKITHYVAWAVSLLACVGTIVFGSLWCKTRKGGGSGSNPYNVISYTFTKEDFDEDSGFFNYKFADGVKNDCRYHLTIDTNDVREHFTTGGNLLMFGINSTPDNIFSSTVSNDVEFEPIEYDVTFWLDEELIPSACYYVDTQTGREEGQFFIYYDAADSTLSELPVSFNYGKIEVEYRYTNNDTRPIYVYPFVALGNNL